MENEGPFHVDRYFPAFLVSEQELESLSRDDTFFAFFCSIGSTCASLLLSIRVGLCVSAPAPDAEQPLAALQWFFGIAGIISYGLAAYYFSIRRGTVARIKAQGEPPEESP